MAVIIDTSGLYALADSDDKYHQSVVNFINLLNDILIVPSPVLPEISYLVNKYLNVDVEIKILSSIYEKQMRLEEIKMVDLPRAIELIKKYKEHKIGIVDAFTVAIAERLNISDIITLDKRHFSLIKPKHVTAFNIYP